MKKVLFFDRNQYSQLKNKMKDEYAFFSITDHSNELKLKTLDDSRKICFDITYLVAFSKQNEDALLNFEQILGKFEDDQLFICDKKYESDLKYLFRYVFDRYEYPSVEKTSDDSMLGTNKKTVPTNVKRIVDLNDEELSSFFKVFREKLYGHDRFKGEFEDLVKSFRIFNKIGEHKVLSLFLMGDSGIGKTEVARTIHKALGSRTKLAKINFGNYSSHDALNSLIGSPRGYVGSENGELIKRVSESDIGLILIDEFEKADIPVFNYFLDVLENGRIVDSQGEEYDVDGYIIIFTSNMNKSEFISRISPELRSRLDYKGMFELLTNEDKAKFMHYRINQIVTAYREKVSSELPDDIHDRITKRIDVTKFKNMRDLNKCIKDAFVYEITTSDV